ncbi:MAG TPA: hypothetical protein VMZ74_14205 [Ramlibacter sp.]|nr:hypothetical protein [Ramlibacter sp.]
MTAVLKTVQHDEELHRQAYNSAFDELGLAWHWDRATFAWLPEGPGRVRTYVEREHPHLLRAYDAEFLVEAVEKAKERCHAVMEGRRSQHAH